MHSSATSSMGWDPPSLLGDRRWRQHPWVSEDRLFFKSPPPPPKKTLRLSLFTELSPNWEVKSFRFRGSNYHLFKADNKTLSPWKMGLKMKKNKHLFLIEIEPNYCWPHLTLAKKRPINQSCVLLQRFSRRPLHLFIPRLYMLDISHAVCPPQHWSTVSGSVSSLAARRCPWPNNSDTDWTNSTPNLLSSPTLYNVRELRITWPSSVLCHFQRNAFVIFDTYLLTHPAATLAFIWSCVSAIFTLLALVWFPPTLKYPTFGAVYSRFIRACFPTCSHSSNTSSGALKASNCDALLTLSSVSFKHQVSDDKYATSRLSK